jgi:hypothetical protein
METNDLDKKLKLPHLLNLNEDPMLSGVLCHFLQADVTIFGRADSQNPPSVFLSGLKYVTSKCIYCVQSILQLICVWLYYRLHILYIDYILYICVNCFFRNAAASLWVLFTFNLCKFVWYTVKNIVS